MIIAMAPLFTQDQLPKLHHARALPLDARTSIECLLVAVAYEAAKVADRPVAAGEVVEVLAAKLTQPMAYETPSYASGGSPPMRNCRGVFPHRARMTRTK